ncbi:MAG: ribose 5-phosphate isomerase B [Marinilabiliales bacterium]|nr:MAG: ribose 5-phosphate isomerase B [Marinilabiliales bacterium]
MPENIRLALGSDHAGFKVKQTVIDHLKKHGYSYRDFGAYSEDASDYPDFAHPVAQAVESGEYDFGIVVCGSGNGVNMVVNKHSGIRSALCWNSDVARVVRLHNDANICALPGRYIDGEQATEIVKVFLNTGFEGGRHLHRINKIPV